VFFRNGSEGDDSLVVDELIQFAIEIGASDIHIAPSALPMFRVNGLIHHAFEERSFEALSFEAVDKIVKGLCSSEQYTHLNEYGEVNFSYSLVDIGRIRVNILRQRGTFSLSIRILKRMVPAREELGLPDALFEAVEKRHGLILVSGPAGSGRSTTTAALIQYINETQEKHIVTVEAPMEYLFRHDRSIVVQRDVGNDCISLEAGIRQALLHDPDVLMISDLGSENVMDLALDAAESGKLVIAGLPAIHSRSVIERFITSEAGRSIERRKQRLAGGLICIFAQQLVPHISGEKRILAYEMLFNNAAVQSSILTGNLSEIQSALISGKRQRMCLMDSSLLELLKRGDIDREQALKYCHDEELLKRLERKSEDRLSI
jgi:twitching motility protein PilT